MIDSDGMKSDQGQKYLDEAKVLVQHFKIGHGLPFRKGHPVVAMFLQMCDDGMITVDWDKIKVANEIKGDLSGKYEVVGEDNRGPMRQIADSPSEALKLAVVGLSFEGCYRTCIKRVDETPRYGEGTKWLTREVLEMIPNEFFEDLKREVFKE